MEVQVLTKSDEIERLNAAKQLVVDMHTKLFEASIDEDVIRASIEFSIEEMGLLHHLNSEIQCNGLNSAIKYNGYTVTYRGIPEVSFTVSPPEGPDIVHYGNSYTHYAFYVQKDGFIIRIKFSDSDRICEPVENIPDQKRYNTVYKSSEYKGSE